MTRSEFLKKYDFKDLIPTAATLPICDMCGEEMKNYTWYYSTPFDGSTTPGKLCQECYDELKKEYEC